MVRRRHIDVQVTAEKSDVGNPTSDVRFLAESSLAALSEMTHPIHIVGGGLAGSEAAWQLAERGHDVVVHEMRGVRGTPAHKTDRLAELVCSNTFKSTETSNAHGLLKAEMRLLGSVVLWAADQARVPGGTALAVDRDVFSAAVHERVTSHPRITVVREEVSDVAEPGDRRHRSAHVRRLGRGDPRRGLASSRSRSTTAIAPIVAHESIDESVVFRASRYGKETMDAAEAEGGRISTVRSRESSTRRSSTRSSRPTSITGTSSTRCRTSRGACPSKRWRGAAERRSASAR